MDSVRGTTPRRWNTKRILAAVGIVLLVLILAGAVWSFRVLHALGGKNPGSVLPAIFNPKGEFPGTDRLVILIAGKDYDHTKQDYESSKNSRSDTIMILSADLANQKLSAVSVPRDMLVKGPDGKNHKINAMLPEGGIKQLEATLEQYLGVKCDHYVILKDQAVKVLVDAVGGVDVNVMDDMFYQDWWGHLNIDLKKGPQHINGDQAIGYVRFRETGNHTYDSKGNIIPSPHRHSLEEGDLRRTERQQALMRALMTQALTPNNLLNAGKIIDVGFSQIDTNLSHTQVVALAKIFKGKSLGDSLTGTLPGKDGYVGGTYFYLPDLANDKLMCQWILDGDESAGRKLVTVSVTNGTNVKGAAKALAEEVNTMGFTASSGGNTKAPLQASSIVYRKAAELPYAQEIGQKLGIAQIAKSPTEDSINNKSELVVQIGPDIKLPQQLTATPSPSTTPRQPR